MERFFIHADRYVRFDNPTRHFLESHGQLRLFNTADYFLLSGETIRYWCFILSGIVATVGSNAAGEPYYRFILLRYSYFTGTKHPFSQSPPGLFIQFLQPTALLVLPLDSFRYAQEHLLPFSNFVQVLKQRRILQQEAMAEVLSAPKSKRYGALYTQLPELFRALRDDERRKLLRVDRATYYKAKAGFKRGY